MATSSAFMARFARPVRGPARNRPLSGCRVEVELRATGPIERPVDLVRRLRDFGASLTSAHAALTCLAETGHTKLGLAGNLERIVEGLAEFGVGVSSHGARSDATGEEPGAPAPGR